MANDSGMVDGLSEQFRKDLKEVNTELLAMIQNIGKANSALSGLKTPSQSDSAVKDLNDQIAKQDKLLAEYQKRLTSLAATQKQSNALSTEELLVRRNTRQEQQMQYKATTELFGAYSRLNAQVALAARKLMDLKASTTASNAEIRKAQKEFDVLQKRVLSADQAVGRWQRTGERSIGLGRDLVGAFGIATGVTLFAALSKDVFDTTRELQSMDLALRQVIGSEEEAAATQAFLSKIAENYGVNIQVLTKSYTGFFASSKNAIESGKISAQQIRDIFQSVAKAAGAMGLSVEQQEGAFLALSQMISKGNIQAEELRGQLSERLPGAFGILAKSMGVTEKELNKMLKDGQVLAAEVLPAFAKELEKAYGVENLQRVETLNAATTRLSNTWVAFVRELNEGGGVFTNILTSIVENFGKTIQGLEFLISAGASKRKKELESIYQSTYDQTKDYYAKIEKESGKGEKAIRAQIEAERDYAAQNAKTNEQTATGLRERNALLEDEMRKEYAKNGANSRGNFARRAEIDSNNESIRELNKTTSYYNGIVRASTDALKTDNVVRSEAVDLTKKQKDAIDKLNEALRKLRETQAQTGVSREIADLERRKFLLEETAKNDKLYLEERIKLYSQIRDLDREIAAKQYLESVRKTTNEIEERRYQLKIDVIDSALSEKEKAIKINEINILYDKILKDEIQIASDKFRADQEKAERESDERINDDKKKNFQEFLDYRAKYGRPNEDPERFGDANMLPTSQLDELVAGWKETQKETDKAKDKLNDYFKSFQEAFFGDIGLPTLFKILNDEIDGFGENAYVTALAVSEVFQEAFNAILEASNQAYETQLTNLEKRKSIEIEFAGDSATARAEIEEQYDARRKEIMRKQAQTSKEIAIFNAVINTAQGVTAALAEANYVLAGIIAVLGAAQIAVIASQPIPEFWKGTDNAPEGLAWTQERGREMIKDKDGNIKSLGSDKGRSKTWLNAGDKVLTASQTRKELDLLAFSSELNAIMANTGISSPVVQNNNVSVIDTKGIAKEIGNALKNRPIYNVNLDKDGFTNHLISKGQRINFKNNRASGKGSSV